MTNDLETIYAELLEKEGYRPNREAGYLVFKSEGYSYVLDYNEDDPDYVRVLFPSFYELETDSSDDVRTALIEAGRTTKVAKGWIQDNRAWAAVEMFLPANVATGEIILRCVAATRRFAEAFTEGMRNQAAA